MLPSFSNTQRLGAQICSSSSQFSQRGRIRTTNKVQFPLQQVKVVRSVKADQAHESITSKTPQIQLANIMLT